MSQKKYKVVYLDLHILDKQNKLNLIFEAVKRELEKEKTRGS